MSGALTGVFVTALVLVPSTAQKFIAIGPFNVNGGTLVFPLTFIINAVLTEVYGYARARRVIWTGLACQVFAALTYWIVGLWPAAPFWHDQAAFMAVLGVAPRIALASLTAYFCGEFANSVILSKMKFAQGGKTGLTQAWRFAASSFIGQFIDTSVFMAVAFAGALAATDLVKTGLTIWLVKVLYGVVALPLSTRFANWAKRVEGIDHLDAPGATNYSPFPALFKDSQSRGADKKS